MELSNKLEVWFQKISILSSQKGLEFPGGLGPYATKTLLTAPHPSEKSSYNKLSSYISVLKF